MDPFSIAAITAAIGLGTSIFGLSQQSDAAEREARLNAQMQTEVSGITQEIEGQRKLQMNLEAIRARREAVRQSQRAQATALTNAVNAGVGVGASGTQGGLAQERGQETRQLTDIYTNQAIGSRIFGLNARLARTQAYYGSRIGFARSDQATGQGIYNLGMNILSSAPQIGRIGASLT